MCNRPQDNLAARAATGFRHLEPFQAICTARLGAPSEAAQAHCHGAHGHGASPFEKGSRKLTTCALASRLQPHQVRRTPEAATSFVMCNRSRKFARRAIAVYPKPGQDVFAAHAATGLRHPKSFLDSCMPHVGVEFVAPGFCHGARGHGATPSENSRGHLRCARLCCV